MLLFLLLACCPPFVSHDALSLIVFFVDLDFVFFFFESENLFFYLISGFTISFNWVYSSDSSQIFCLITSFSITPLVSAISRQMAVITLSLSCYALFVFCCKSANRVCIKKRQWDSRRLVIAFYEHNYLNKVRCVTLPEISDKMAVVCWLICIKSIHSGLSFLLGNR